MSVPLFSVGKSPINVFVAKSRSVQPDVIRYGLLKLRRVRATPWCVGQISGPTNRRYGSILLLRPRVSKPTKVSDVVEGTLHNFRNLGRLRNPGPEK